jgi:hypothetical protein
LPAAASVKPEPVVDSQTFITTIHFFLNTQQADCPGTCYSQRWRCLQPAAATPAVPTPSTHLLFSFFFKQTSALHPKLADAATSLPNIAPAASQLLLFRPRLHI